MQDINLPVHVVEALERRWAARLEQEASSWKEQRARRLRLRRSLRPGIEVIARGRPSRKRAPRLAV